MGKSTVAESIFSKLLHVGLVVRDLDKTTERLSSLGIGPFKTVSLPPDSETLFRGKPMHAELRIKSAKMGEVELEFIQPVDGESPHKEFLDSKGEGIQHIAFAVDDLDKAIAELTQQGASVLLSANVGGGVAYFDLDAGGLIIELMQK